MIKVEIILAMPQRLAAIAAIQASGGTVDPDTFKGPTFENVDDVDQYMGAVIVYLPAVDGKVVTYSYPWHTVERVKVTTSVNHYAEVIE